MNRKQRRAAAKSAPGASRDGLLAAAARHHQAGRLRQAEGLYRQILTGDPDDTDCLHLLGLAAHQTGRSEEALRLIERAIVLNGADPDPHNDIAGIYQALGRFDAAVAHCRRALALSPSSTPFRLNLARALHAQGDLAGAVAQYRQVLKTAPDTLEPHFNLALALHEEGETAAAAAHYRQVLALCPDHAEAHAGLGQALARQGHWSAAITHYRAALAVQPDATETLNALGDALAVTGDMPSAIAAVEHAAAQLDSGRVRANLAYFKRQACDWTNFERTAEQVLERVRQGAGDVPPFVTLMLAATPTERLQAARQWGERFARGLTPFSHTRGAAKGAIRLGYLSHDLRGDVVGRLIPELIERHDRARFHVGAYCYGSDDRGETRRRLRQGFDEFTDISGLSDAAAAERIHADGIDILIDITGYTSENPRPRILAFRPAPIQVSYLGFPGSIGAGFIDYIIADGFLAPAEHQAFFSEKLVHLPHCYQPSDTARPGTVAAVPRRACDLPEEGFVFCCFNHSYKLTPAVFDIWMRLLQAMPQSVLWLIESNTASRGNLRCEAIARGVAPERLVFAKHAAVPEYLARLATADLFLDTLPYNAGAVANDALWAGLPVLTCAGSSYAGRMAGSLLHAIGLSELVTGSLADYEARALQLARNPASLAELRGRLTQNRTRMPLFDMARYTRGIEAAYAEMWNRWHVGQSPAPIRIRP